MRCSCALDFKLNIGLKEARASYMRAKSLGRTLILFVIAFETKQRRRLAGFILKE